jgi:hypothetical protein
MASRKNSNSHKNHANHTSNSEPTPAEPTPITKDRVKINLGIDQKINMGNYESVGCTFGISVDVELSDDLPQKLQQIIEKTQSALSFNNNINNLRNLVISNKDEMLKITIKTESEKISEKGSLKQYYLFKQ